MRSRCIYLEVVAGNEGMIARGKVSGDVYSAIEIATGIGATHVYVEGQLCEERRIEEKKRNQEGGRKSKFFEHLLVL